MPHVLASRGSHGKQAEGFGKFYISMDVFSWPTIIAERPAGESPQPFPADPCGFTEKCGPDLGILV